MHWWCTALIENSRTGGDTARRTPRVKETIVGDVLRSQTWTAARLCRLFQQAWLYAGEIGDLPRAAK
jgi:hypothetical protein